jgi:hypothetical protein
MMNRFVASACNQIHLASWSRRTTRSEWCGNATLRPWYRLFLSALEARPQEPSIVDLTGRIHLLGGIFTARRACSRFSNCDRWTR